MPHRVKSCRSDPCPCEADRIGPTLGRVVSGSPGDGERAASVTSSLAAAAALADVSRRRMYEFIRAGRRPITREEAAASVGISRKLAAFHLDKLVEVGLLRASFAPVGGIRRVGRTPKVYEPTEAGVQISIPERQHVLLAEVLIDAVQAEDGSRSAREAATDIVRERGVRLGEEERERLRPGRLGSERALTTIAAVLAAQGFEPDREGPARLRLHNCPFQPLAGRAPDLICGLNYAFLTGVVDGLRARSAVPLLRPRPGGCCVEIAAR
jgi:predicted ArsR family transcriptional regulator